MSFSRHLIGYKITFSKQAEKDFTHINKKDTAKILNKLNSLISGSLNLDIKKLASGDGKAYRMRCGNYRIIFEIKHSEVIILVVGVGHRKEIYKKLPW